MNKKAQNHLNRIKRRKRVRRRALPVVLLLCLALGFGVFWGLRGDGIAMEDESILITSANVRQGAPPGTDETVGANEGESQTGEEVPGETPEGESQTGEEVPGETPEGESQTGEEVPGETPEGEGQTDEESPEETPEGESQTGEESPEETPEGEGQTGEEPSAGGQEEIERESFHATSPAGVQVWAVAPKDAFGQKVSMTVKDVSKTEALQAAERAAAYGDVVLDAVAVDICFLDENGNELDPLENQKVEVKISLPTEQALSEGEICLIHQHDDGSVELVSTEQKTQEGAVFETETFSVYVITALGSSEKDKIHEFLNGYNFYSAPVSGGYYVNHVNAPYVLYVGEVLELYATEGSTDGYRFWVDGNGNPGILGRTAEHPQDFDVTHRVGDTYQNYIHAQYVANRTGKVAVHLDRDDNAWWFNDILFYVEVLDNNDQADHADIEIADGGWYKDVKTVYDAQGNYVRTTYVYESEVTKVNHAYVYDKNNAELQHYVTRDYMQNGQPGTTQYELTSKWDSEGHDSTKRFRHKDADHALFDVDITYFLREKVVETGTYGQSNGTAHTTPASEISESEAESQFVVQSIQIPLGPQAVIDARNKCPNHSGLDFTSRLRTQKNYVVVSMEGKKTVTGGTLEPNLFQFELVDEDGGVIDVTSNDEYGNIVFQDLTYELENGTVTPGTPLIYNYKIREVIPDVPGPYQYDTTEIPVTVQISMDEDGIITAELLNPNPFGTFEFVNEATYLLPQTGGGGTIIYLTAGIMLIGFAAFLLCRRRIRVN